VFVIMKQRRYWEGGKQMFRKVPQYYVAHDGEAIFSEDINDACPFKSKAVAEVFLMDNELERGHCVKEVQK